MRLNTLLGAAALLASGVYGIDVGNSVLSGYKLGDLVGLHTVSLYKETPPSVSNLTFYLNINKDKKPNKDVGVEHCPENSQICGLNRLSLPGKEDLVTEIISFPNSMKMKVEEDDEKKSVSVVLRGANWGQKSIDLKVTFVCESEDSGLELGSWDEQTLELKWLTPLLCKGESKGGDKKKEKEPKEPEKGGDNGEDTSHWGWFTWLFIFMVIIFAAHIIFNLWMNANNGGGGEFMTELTDSLIDVLHRLPSFLKEIWGKIFGVADRGGYSAV